jgi:hypothetical protein
MVFGLIWFSSNSCVFYPLAKAPWIKIISSHKPWKILYILQGICIPVIIIKYMINHISTAIQRQWNYCNDVIRPFLVFSLFCVSSKLWNLPASQGKKQTSFKKQNCLCMLFGCQTQQKFDQFHISAKEVPNKVQNRK